MGARKQRRLGGRPAGLSVRYGGRENIRSDPMRTEDTWTPALGLRLA